MDDLENKGRDYQLDDDPFKEIDEEFEELQGEDGLEGATLEEKTLEDVLEEDGGETLKEKVIGFIDDFRTFLWASIMVVVLAVIGILIMVYLNLTNYVNDLGDERGDVVDIVGVEEYERIKKKSEENTKKEKTDQEKRVLEKEKRMKRREEILEQIGDEELEEGNVWYKDEDGKFYQSKPKTSDYAMNEEDYKVREEGVEELFEEEEIKIIPPKDSVIDELSLSIEDIDFNKVYLTKGQFIYWLQDTFIYTMDEHGYLVQTFWDDDTKECIVKVKRGKLEEVKALSEDLIKKTYNASSYGIYNENEITVNYEQGE